MAALIFLCVQPEGREWVAKNTGTHPLPQAVLTPCHNVVWGSKPRSQVVTEARTFGNIGCSHLAIRLISTLRAGRP